MRILWHELGSARTDAADRTAVELHGFPVSVAPSRRADHFLMVAEPACCAGCAPRSPLAAVEVFAAAPLPMQMGALRLTGEWRVLPNDPAGCRYQLREARVTQPPGWRGVTRRGVLAGGPLICLDACAKPADPAAARAIISAGPTVDVHSHAGGIARSAFVRSGAGISRVAEPMRAGGMGAVCLAVVSDGPTHRLMPDGRLHPFRDPAPGELYAYAQMGFRRVNEMARDQGIAVIADMVGLRAAGAGTPSAIIAAEGADFLEGQADRVDEAYAKWTLRHLQLTHYRVNELGDIQTEPPVHGGLTDTGAEVIRRCNRLGVVVDVAHGTYALVKRAAAVTTKPLVLSHTSLSANPGAFSRLVSREHAQVVAGTGGVVGIWPPATVFSSLTAMATGMARMVDAIGVDHVGLGTDMRGLVGGSVFPDYDSLPDLAQALLTVGFSPPDARKLLGANYARVFAATMA
jgi:membrane dipeptidase